MHVLLAVAILLVEEQVYHHSTIGCCLDWNIALNTHQHLDIIYLDYAKAFDSVVHTKLLAKLAQYGINDLLLF